MFKTILALLVIAVGGLAVYIHLQPAEFAVERTGTMKASPEVVFAQINDFHKWEAWSPWAKLDPKAKVAFEGPDAGKGAKFAWHGNSEVGKGTMEILESVPNDHIKIKLDFEEPHEGHSITLFTLKSEGDQTKVNWKMTGENSYMGKAMCLVMNMDKMVGEMFEKGLTNMKTLVEAEPKKEAVAAPK